MQTVVHKWFRDKDFGFLQNGGGPDIMVCKSDLVNCQFLKPGVNVEFECHIDHGKLSAKKVKLLKSELRTPQNRNKHIFGVMT